jgi:hypothetical protein
MDSVDLDAIAQKLYGLSPDAFTSSRSAEVRAARSAGDRELAAAVAQLRRPTVGAWLANQLARERKDQLEALLDLGTSMRRAQELGDGPELRLLSRQRRQMVAGLVSEATRLARRRDQPLSENSRRELENTLEAGVATVDAADALRSGRLNVGLTYSGFGPLDLAAPDISDSSTRTVQRKSAAAGSAGERHKQRDDRSRLKLDLAEAERRVKSAEDAVEATRQETNDVQTECAALRGEIVAAERHLRQTKKRLEAAQRRLVNAKQADKMAKNEVLRARSQRDKAETLLHLA